MATDATGSVTSPDSIPTYNTAVDSPSGKGLNNIVAAIQTALSARIAKSLLTTTGDLIYASGSSVAARLGIGSTGQVLTVAGGLPTWAAAPGVLSYRKTTTKTVNTTAAATDLLNGEITVGAGVMGTTGLLRLTAWGDWLNNASTLSLPRFQVVFGGSTLIDTNATTAQSLNSGNRYPWRVQVEIENANSASAQIVAFNATLGLMQNAAFAGTFLTGTGVHASTSVAGNHSAGWLTGVGTGAVATASAQALLLNVINPSSSASVETKLFGALVEII